MGADTQLSVQEVKGYRESTSAGGGRRWGAVRPGTDAVAPQWSPGALELKSLHRFPKLRPRVRSVSLPSPSHQPRGGFRENLTPSFPSSLSFLYEFRPEEGILIASKHINTHPVFSSLKSSLSGSWLQG